MPRRVRPAGRLPPADTKQRAVREPIPSGRGGGGATPPPPPHTRRINHLLLKPKCHSKFSEEKEQDLRELETGNPEKQRNGLDLKLVAILQSNREQPPLPLK